MHNSFTRWVQITTDFFNIAQSLANKAINQAIHETLDTLLTNLKNKSSIIPDDHWARPIK